MKGFIFVGLFCLVVGVLYGQTLPENRWLLGRWTTAAGDFILLNDDGTGRTNLSSSMAGGGLITLVRGEERNIFFSVAAGDAKIGTGGSILESSTSNLQLNTMGSFGSIRIFWEGVNLWESVPLVIYRINDQRMLLQGTRAYRQFRRQ